MFDLLIKKIKFWIFVFFSVVLGVAPETAKVKIVNAPEDGSVLINGLQLTKDNEGWYRVSHGPLLVEIERNDTILFSALYSLDSAEEKVITFNCKEKCASFNIKTDPIGALLIINGEVVGTTPYINNLFTPDTYSIMVTLPTYVPLIKKIVLSADSPTILNYKLELTPAAKDSLFAAKEELKKKRRIITSSLFGGIALISGAIGAYFDWKASKYIEEANKNSEAYNKAKSDTECNIHKQLYFDNKREAEKKITNRNIFYGVSGAFAVGFYVSMFF